MDSRESLLKDLLSFTRPISDIARDLSAYGWDAPDPLVVLDAVRISSVLSRFMAGELSSVQVDDWANCIELRDDIEYDPSSAVGLALHELANPVLTCPLTRQSAAALVATLSYLQANPSFKRTASRPLNSSVRVTMRNVTASGLLLLGLLCTACAPTPLGPQGKALAATLSKLNIGNPATDAALRVRRGDMRPVGIYGYTCSYPGAASKALDDLQLKNGLRCLEGTSDAPESARHRKLIQVASSYASAYNTVLVRLAHPG